jgi:hypothetical protein
MRSAPGVEVDRVEAERAEVERAAGSTRSECARALPQATHVLLGQAVETIATYVGLLGVDFTARWPPDLRATLRERAARYERATR